MQENSKISLRETLEAMPTSQLGEMLRAELKKEPADPDLVRKILDVLDTREADSQEPLDAQAEQQWAQYQKRITAMKPKRRRISSRRWKWLLTTAAALVLVAAVVLPQRVEAESIWDMLVRWRQEILEFIRPGDVIKEYESEFQTDNPAMQQIYDAVLELGVERPLVPMWFDEYSLFKLSEINTSSLNGVIAELICESEKAVLRIDAYKNVVFRGYSGDNINYDSYEKEGAKFEITRNNDRWVAVWIKDKTEYSLTVDCEEDTLHRILASIYVTEE